MRRTKRRMLIALMLVGSVLLPAAARVAAEDVAPARTASCILKVTCDPAVLPLDSNMIQELLRTSAVVNKASRLVLGMPIEQLEKITTNVGCNFAALQGGGGDPRKGRFWRLNPVRRPITAHADAAFVLGVIDVQLPGEDADVTVPPKAQEFLTAICQNLLSVLEQAHADHTAPINVSVKNASGALAQAEHEYRTLQARRLKLTEQAGRSDLRHEHVVAEIQDLERQKQQLEMELAGKAARRKAIEEQIAKAASVSGRDKDKDLVDALLRLQRLKAKTRVTQARTDLEWAERLAAARQASERDVLKSRRELALAELEVEVAELSGDAPRLPGPQMAKLTDSLAEISIDTAEMAALLKHLTQRLARIRARNLLGLADEYEREVSLRLPLAQQAFERASQRLEELNRLRQLPGPTVTIIGEP